MTEKPFATDANPVPLAEMIETLRQELQEARARGEGKNIGFEFDKVELELNVAITRKAKGQGGVAFWVIKADASVEGSQAATHSFKLTLKPIDRSGGRLQVADQSEKPASSK